VSRPLNRLGRRRSARAWAVVWRFMGALYTDSGKEKGVESLSPARTRRAEGQPEKCLSGWSGSSGLSSFFDLSGWSSLFGLSGRINRATDPTDV